MAEPPNPPPGPDGVPPLPGPRSGPRPNARTAVFSDIEMQAIVAQAMPEMKDFGPYQILDRLGEGGMGVVYKARQKGLGRVVALKVLIPGEHASSAQVDRFVNEAKASAKLNHPNIVPVYDFGVHEGRHYFTMQFIEGKTLEQMLARDPTTYTRRPQEAVRLLRPILDALAHAHAAGIIHRDLKPANIILDSSGAPLLMDFGLAKDVVAGSKLTKTGMAVGTPSYMPPEQATGKQDLIDARSDGYSIGAILYEMLTARPPFEGATLMETMERVVRDDPVRPSRYNPDMPRDLETIIMKCLEKSQAARYPSALLLGQDLDRFLNDEPIQARPAGSIERVVKLVKRHRTPVIAGTIGGAVALAALAVLIWKLSVWQGETAEEARKQTVAAALDGAQKALVADHLPDAIRRFEEVLKRDGKNREATLGLQEARSRLESRKHDLLSRGEEAMRKNHWAEAAGCFRAALELVPGDPEIRRLYEFSSQENTMVLFAANPAGARIVAFPVDGATFEVAGEGTPVSGDRPTTAAVPIKRGRYVLEFSAPECASARLPTDLAELELAARGREVRIELRLPDAAAVPDGMIVIPGGTFIMGGDAMGADPERVVSLKTFAIDRDEVTVGKYVSFLKATGHPPPPSWEGGKPPADWADLPMTEVSFFDAQAYAEWAGKRLPTEEEYEKAARGTDGRPYPWGTVFQAERVNSESEGATPGDETPGDLSPYGVRSLAGNVCEWTSSVWSERGRQDLTTRVVRGNSWSHAHVYGSYLLDHVARRQRQKPEEHAVYLGFRCAKDLAE